MKGIPRSRLVLWVVIGMTAFRLGGGVARGEGRVDHGLYAELLQTYVHRGVVDYAGFQREEARLDAYLDRLAETDTGALSRDEQLAVYINAYNAWTLKLILSAWPEIDSIKDLGGLFTSPWEKKLVRLDGMVMTLDHLEHEIIRPRFRDPRIHFAVSYTHLRAHET